MCHFENIMVPNVEGVVFCVSFEKSGQTLNTQHPYNIGRGGGNNEERNSVAQVNIHPNPNPVLFIY